MGTYRRPLIIVALVVVAVLYSRVFFGLDLVDEAFYLALPYRFFLGDRPFVDELNVAQAFTFLTYPIVRFYLALTGGKVEGLVLFTRHLYLLWTLGLVTFVFLW